MRHDYELPPDWDAMTQKERSDWMVRERCRRQAKQQDTATEKKRKHRKKRINRVLEARGYHPVRSRR